MQTHIENRVLQNTLTNKPRTFLAEAKSNLSRFFSCRHLTLNEKILKATVSISIILVLIYFNIMAQSIWSQLASNQSSYQLGQIITSAQLVNSAYLVTRQQLITRHLLIIRHQLATRHYLVTRHQLVTSVCPQVKFYSVARYFFGLISNCGIFYHFLAISEIFW